MMEDNRQGQPLITCLEKSRSVYCACVGSAKLTRIDRTMGYDRAASVARC